jgi:tetratricopeptide (TPR) repeat protein/tRNA A-37 threonylcarbamoyl transferase component Bud32
VNERLAAALSDRYRIERQLGQGGMAMVYLAHDLKHDREVAIKVLRPEVDSVLGADRFLREIATTARLAHPGILPLFDSGRDEGLSWYAMPLITGKTLRDRLEECGRLSLEEAVRVFTDVAGALEHAHRHGVLHRDLKPENILLQDERAVLADFGIALPVAEARERLTQTGFSLGTPAYMSPEQAMGERALDARSDVYALGCVLFEMLAGHPPFTGANAQAMLARRLTEPAPDLASLREVPAAIDIALRRALARDPEDRFVSVADFAAVVAGRSGAATRAARSMSARRRSYAALVIGAIVLAGVGWVLTRPGRTAKASQAREVNPAAQAAYLQAQRQLRLRTQAGLTNALRLLRQAIGRDSNYALAWAGLAQALGWARSWEFDAEGVPADSLLVRQLEASDRALALDSTNVEMWFLRAQIASAIDPTSNRAAINSLRHILAIDSMNAEAWNDLGWALEHVGDRDGAVAAMQRGVALGRNPVSLANHYYWWRIFDSAAVWADSAVVMDPQLAWAHETVGAVALAQGHIEKARAAYEAARRLDTGPTSVRSLEGLAEIAVTQGDTNAALDLIRQAEALTDSAAPSGHAVISLASAYAAVGDRERSVAWLERNTPRASLHFQLHLRQDLQLDPVRSLPRFQALLSPL